MRSDVWAFGGLEVWAFGRLGVWTFGCGVGRCAAKEKRNPFRFERERELSVVESEVVFCGSGLETASPFVVGGGGWRWSMEVNTLFLQLEQTFVGCPLSFVRESLVPLRQTLDTAKGPGENGRWGKFEDRGRGGDRPRRAVHESSNMYCVKGGGGESTINLEFPLRASAGRR